MPEAGCEHRTHFRADASCSIDIDDGSHRPFGGVAKNVSLSGIHIDDLPTDYVVQGKEYTIWFIDRRSETAYFTLKASPCWRKEDEYLGGAGFKILGEPPPGWRRFIRKLRMKAC